ncbi:MAG: hypothetical protein P4L51_18760 [Puia sp.]|nr:hypothetical protein [Puia sp.]
MESIRPFHFLVGVVIIFAAACNSGPVSSIVFDRPQPAGAKDLSQFPQKISGAYRAEDSSSILNIREGLVIRKTRFDLKVAADSLDSCCLLSGDTLIDKSSGEKTGVTVQRFEPGKINEKNSKSGKDSSGKDSIVLHLDWADTLFRVSTDHILRSYRQYYLLNERSDDSTWVVRSLDLHDNILTMRYIPDSVALHYLGESGHDTPGDSDGAARVADSTASTGIRLQVSRRQFRKMVRQNGFAEGERFVRMGDSADLK